MPICSYVVVPAEGAAGALAETLTRMPRCEVVPADNGEVLLLVTDTDGVEAEAELRRAVEALDGIEALLLTFGEIDPDAEAVDAPRPGEAP